MSEPEGWMRDLVELRQRAAVIVSAPARDEPAAEVYAQTRQEAVDALVSWDEEDLLFAVRARQLDVPQGADARRLAEALVAAGPAFFGESVQAWPEECGDCGAKPGRACHYGCQSMLD